MKRRHVPTDPCRASVAGPVVWIGLVLLTAFASGVHWMLLTSLKDRQELYATPLSILPFTPPSRIISMLASPVHAVQPVLSQ